MANRNTIIDTAKVEFDIIGPDWLGLGRFRFFMDNHSPEDHLTVWKLENLSNYIGSYTPPAWFLKLIRQIK